MHIPSGIHASAAVLHFWRQAKQSPRIVEPGVRFKVQGVPEGMQGQFYFLPSDLRWRRSGVIFSFEQALEAVHRLRFDKLINVREAAALLQQASDLPVLTIMHPFADVWERGPLALDDVMRDAREEASKDWPIP